MSGCSHTLCTVREHRCVSGRTDASGKHHTSELLPEEPEAELQLWAYTLLVWELSRYEGSEQDTHKEQGGAQRGLPVVVTHQIPLREREQENLLINTISHPLCKRLGWARVKIQPLDRKTSGWPAAQIQLRGNNGRDAEGKVPSPEPQNQIILGGKDLYWVQPCVWGVRPLWTTLHSPWLWRFPHTYMSNGN